MNKPLFDVDRVFGRDSIELRENALQLLSQMVPHEIHCSPANHPFLATSREAGKSLQVGLDRDWMPYQE